jgi:hypothetical protein
MREAQQGLHNGQIRMHEGSVDVASWQRNVIFAPTQQLILWQV